MYSHDELINEINNLEATKWLDNYMKENDGREYNFGQCYECGIWHIGSKRCSCGNRRVSYCAEGNFIDGYYLEVEAF